MLESLWLKIYFAIMVPEVSVAVLIVPLDW